MAECTTETFHPIDPPPVGSPTGQTHFHSVVFAQGTSAANSDTLTVPGFVTIKGCFLMATDGTVGTVTLGTNVITITNGGTKTWSGLVWGV